MKSLHVSIPKQQMTLSENGEVIKTYSISSSEYGIGFEPGSFKTPTGNFIIGEKHGDGYPPFTMFKGRVATGVVWSPEYSGTDPIITSRILWLDGKDPENANTKSRYIYIHGTGDENEIGSPVGHGCIRMKNNEIIELYDLVDVGTPMIIENK